MGAKKEKNASAGEQPSTSGSELSNIVYIGHIPHGFYENQMKDYFSQFGEVTKVRLSRSKKTGRSKHYAFVEFKLAEVARIVADAMNGYMFFKQRLEARVMLKSQVHKNLMKGANRPFKVVDWRKKEMERHNAEKTRGQERTALRRALKKDQQRQEKIKNAGIEFEYEGLASKVPAKPTKKTFDE